MARCGHVGQCNCVLVGGPGIGVSGIGTPEQRYETRVRLSADSGNRLRFDGQGALYAGGGEGGGDSGCGVSVVGLPPEHLVVGRGGAGRLIAPDHTLLSYRRAVDMSLPATHARCRPLSDGTPAVFPAISTRNQSGSFPQLEQWADLPNNHGDYLIPNMDLSAYKRMPIFAGWERELQTDREMVEWSPGGGAPSEWFNEQNIGGRWGFFGFGARFVEGGLTLSELLSEIALRTVINIELATTTPLFIQHVMETIRRHCCQEAVIVSSRDATDLVPFIDENIATMLWITGPEGAALNPPEQLLDQGVRWVNIDASVPDSTIIRYTSAGMDVIIGTLSRHYHWRRVDELGARGALADDPVYMMGADDPSVYRVASGHTSLRHHGVYPGQLTRATDQGSYVPPWARGEKLMGWGPDDSSVRFSALLPPVNGSDATQWMNSSAPLNKRRMSGYGLLIPRTTTSASSQYISPWGGSDVLAGWLCPIENPRSYAIEYQVSFCTSPNQGGRNIGIFFGMPDDRSVQDHMDAGTSIWQATFQWNGSVYLRRYAGGEAVETENGNFGDTPNVGSWYRVRVIVDDISVRVQRVSFSGVVLGELSMAGEAHGGYFALFKNETGTNGNLYLFTSGHRQLLVRSPYQGEGLDPLNSDGSYPWEIGEGEDVPGTSRLQAPAAMEGALVDELGEPVFATDEDDRA